MWYGIAVNKVSKDPGGQVSLSDAFQQADWDTPGWELAKEVVVALTSVSHASPASNSVTNPKTLDFETKIYLLQQAMKAATQSFHWVEFLIAVAGELNQDNYGSESKP